MGWTATDLSAGPGNVLAQANPTAYFTADGTRHVVHLGHHPTIPAYKSSIIQWYFRRDGSDSGAINLMIGDEDAQPAQGMPTAYYYAAEGTQHIVTGMSDPFGHLQEFWYDGDWHAHDLTATSAAPWASSLPRGYDFEPYGGHNQHIVYGGIDAHIHELARTDSSWNRYDLTEAAGAPNAVGDPFGYAFNSQQTQHVIFRGAGRNGGDLHELWWNRVDGWIHEPLSEQVCAPAASSEPFGYVFASQGTQHVLYIGLDGHVHELWWDSTGWHQNDLSGVPGTTPPFTLGGAAPTGIADPTNGTQHIYYVDVDYHLISLDWTP